MEQLVITGDNLKVVKNVIKAMGNYKVSIRITDESTHKDDKPIIPGTCSACPYFTDLIDRPEQWGRCAKYGDAAGNRNRPFCRAYKEEIGYRTIKED